jgi:phosphoglycerol transferase MdoB-like AlkP superfamily enzyme
MNFEIPNNRYSILNGFVLFFLIASFIIRTILLLVSVTKTGFSALSLLHIYTIGFVYDFGVALFFVLSYSIYLLLLPQKWNKGLFNRIATYVWLFLVLLITLFSFFAEITFWQEFESRFNFIAVDYLVYTFEVINNINQSYPLPLLIGGMLLINFAAIWFFSKKQILERSFKSNTPFAKRLLITGSIVCLTVLYGLFLDNAWAESSTNRYQNELSKAGIYSFFAAFKNNELPYDHFYSLISNKAAFSSIKKELNEPGTTYDGKEFSIFRNIVNKDNASRPNVIMITIESLSADFMGRYGNTQNLMPFLDSLAGHSVVFDNLYATGTRTVRGMEALSIAIPPTPGNSIVRRPDNNNLLTIGSIFKAKGYDRTFFYGGDGYFDNMNQYFGTNGFDIVDRGRNLGIGDTFSTKHTIIQDNKVHFENAWGICDEDLFDAVIEDADKKSSSGKPFYNFVMTTSNHRPFTYPAGKINIPSGSSREGAVRYTDYAIRQFIKKSRTKPWFKNTVIVIIADHCASSAGKNEIDISKYHIPAMIYNLNGVPDQSITQMCSQIDLYPTLFGLLGWNYQSNLYGKNVLEAGYNPRIILGTYQKLAYMSNDSLVILSPQQKVESFLYDKVKNEQIPNMLSTEIKNKARSYYQTAYFLFKNGGLKDPSVKDK